MLNDVVSVNVVLCESLRYNIATTGRRALFFDVLLFARELQKWLRCHKAAELQKRLAYYTAGERWDKSNRKTGSGRSQRLMDGMKLMVPKLPRKAR